MHTESLLIIGIVVILNSLITVLVFFGLLLKKKSDETHELRNKLQQYELKELIRREK